MRSLLAFTILLLATARAQVPIHVDSQAGPWGNGSVTHPFDSLDDVAPLIGNASDLILLRRGSVFLTANTLDLPSNTRVATYGTGAKPVIDMGGAESTIGVRTEDVVNVTIEDLVVRRANRGFLFLGSATQVRVIRCEAIEIYANDGFTHTDEPSALTASGSVVYEGCRAFRCDGDGFNNAGFAADTALACEAIHCGPKWGDHETPPAAPRRRVIWVDGVNGDDANDGLSQSAALKTLAAVRAVSRPDDEIRLMRGSRFAGTLSLQWRQYVRAWGKGPRPRIEAGAFAAAVVVPGAVDVRLEALHLTGSRVAVAALGDVDGLELVDCHIDGNRNGVLALGAGAVSIHESRLERNRDTGISVRGDVMLLCVKTTVSGHDTLAHSTGLVVDGRASAVVVACSLRGNATGMRLAGSGAAPLVVSTHVSESLRDERGLGIHVLREAGSGAALVVNSVICTPEPNPTSDVHGVLAESDVHLLNSTLYNANTGDTGTITRSVTLRAAAEGSTVINCVFDDADVAEARFLEVESGLASAMGNWFHAPQAVEGKWLVRQTPLAFFGWTRVAGVADALTGGVTALSMVRDDPSRFAWYASLAGAAGRAPREGGVDLSLLFASLGVPAEDFGRRPRGIDGTWSSGALEHRTYSADGFTTHDASAFRIVSCDVRSCSDGVHFTHLNPSGDETAVIDCEFRDILEVGLNGALNQNWETRDCKFISCERGAGGIRPAIGTTQVFDSCLFVDCGEAAIHADPVFPARIRLQNCVVVLPEAIDREEGYGVNVAAGQIGLDVFNSTFVVPTLDTEDSPTFAVHCREGTLALYNNVFTGARGDDAYYVRIPERSQILEADHNFYEVESPWDVRWLCVGPRNFGAWRGLRRGRAGADTDSRGSAQPRRLVAASGDPRARGTAEYFVASDSPAYGVGRSAFALFSRAWGDERRPASGAWNTGPSALGSVAETIRRETPGAIRFRRFSVDAGSGLDIRLANRSVEATGEVVRVSHISFAHAPNVTVVIHEGAFPGTRVLWSGSPATGPVVFSGVLQGRPYEDVYVSFIGGPGRVSGVVRRAIH